ncbi:hypothetical protein [Paenibacillus arenilitoris]|uniref:Uncharacterized protein n=1 Tax=Paenibacillus arenilitoris TaxID=2772299 RepID=A0A927CKH5_9BACL|nr:hypothetical protein [Paenibacillus arenilitoris]MBD2869714.1 hypothetical protein [Paenibacillus arenilitoris]
MVLKRITVLLVACFALFLHAQAAFASPGGAHRAEASSETGLKPVQVFDVQAGKVVKTIPNDRQFQTFASSWISSITGLAPQLTSDASCSFVYRIPLEKKVTFKANDIAVASDDLFLFYCKDKPPLLLVFDDARKPYLFLFGADIKPFIQKVGIPAS